MARTAHTLSAMSIFRWPLILGGATLVGLGAALLGDGVWDGLSVVLLGLPVALALWLMTQPAPMRADS
ncbi:MAG TPA: hypothetical protein VFI93_10325 [Rhizomicrobium sp.]|jgi:hypothetical protein|nr:hypothetical protein [Rhizomicrobium sp.]